MDLRMPEMDGVEATRQITAAHEDTRVVVLTTFDLDEYVYASLRAGASAFLLKDAKEDQLLSAIRIAAQGGSIFAPTVTARLIERFTQDAPPPVPSLPGPDASASARCSCCWRAVSPTPRSPSTW